MRALDATLETLESCARVLSVAGAWFVSGRRPESSTMAKYCSFILFGEIAYSRHPQK